MSLDPTSAFEFRDAAMRMVAATEYFKAFGELPVWARAELASWRDSDADAGAGAGQHHSGVAAPS